MSTRDRSLAALAQRQAESWIDAASGTIAGDELVEGVVGDAATTLRGLFERAKKMGAGPERDAALHAVAIACELAARVADAAGERELGSTYRRIATDARWETRIYRALIAAGLIWFLTMVERGKAGASFRVGV